MQIGALLFPAKHRNLVVVHGVVGQDVDREIEPHTRAVTADRGWPDRDADEVFGLVLEQQRLAQALELVVQRQWHQGMLFRHPWGLGVPIDGGRGGVDETFDPLFFRCDHHGLEALVVDFLAQLLVQFESRVVGNAGEMDDRVHSPAGVTEFGRVPDVPFDDLQPRLRL